MTNILEVRDLKKYFSVKGGGILGNKVSNQVKAVDGVSFNLKKGETFGIVGESGCGKSTTGRLILQLLEKTDGQVMYEGKDLSELSKVQMKNMRKDIQIIFQDPFASLNPRMKVKDIIAEPIINFKLTKSRKDTLNQVTDLIEKVGLNKSHLDRYPHQFSGGQRQRIGIARALASRPKIIIADEPVSALDVSIQSQILNLLRRLQKEMGITYIFISHDLSVVKHFCDRIGVMYLGKVVEIANKDELYNNSLHPYTEALLSAIPEPDLKEKKERIILSGDVPSPSNPPSGCTFHTRCPYVMDECKSFKPQLLEKSDSHEVRCFKYHNVEGELLNEN